MAKKNKSNKQLIPLLRTAVDTLFSNPIILFPFCIVAFIQLLILEILYFSPRYPLVLFFGPLIRRIWSENFLHYPFNFILLPKLFQYCQIPVYILISSFLIATAIYIISEINNDRKISFGTAIKEISRYYLRIVVIALLSFITFYLLFAAYSKLIDRAMMIRSQSGTFYILKRIVIDGAPYVHLLIGTFVTTIYAFVVPLIVIDRKKIFKALFYNFKTLWQSYWFVFLVVILPTLMYVPVLLLRNNFSILSDTIFPGVRVVVLALSVFVVIAIDATVYTAITTYYLLKKENK